jgi:hypothetical protein
VGIAGEGTNTEAELREVTRDGTALLPGGTADENGVLVWMRDHCFSPSRKLVLM